MNGEEVKLDTSDPIGAACAGQIIKDIKSGDLENVGNLSIISETFSCTDKSANNSKIVLSRNTVTMMVNGKTTVEARNVDEVNSFAAQGFTITGTKVEEITG
tara:strand:- start:77 stop:382 length:306 start_codon:yes stop_codon:yes gene_type:complete